MQGQVLVAGSDRSIILGDDRVRYTFTSLEWRSDDVQPEAGMRVDFEARGSGAADIYPIPEVPPTPSGPSTTAASSADERVNATLGRIQGELNSRYGPIREAIGNYGVIAVGAGLFVLGAFIGFDVFEALRDLMSMAAMLVGAAVAAVGIFMLGKEEGWWGEGAGPDGQAGSAPPSTGEAPRPQAETHRAERTASGDAGAQPAGPAGAAGGMKDCPHCGRAIRSAAIKCRYCGSDIPPKAESP